ncbi:Nn.00g065930.m01.CDS01 [Neocucurbitaria sp. VM-36]
MLRLDLRRLLQSIWLLWFYDGILRDWLPEWIWTVLVCIVFILCEGFFPFLVLIFCAVFNYAVVLSAVISPIVNFRLRSIIKCFLLSSSCVTHSGQFDVIKRSDRHLVGIIFDAG